YRARGVTPTGLWHHGSARQACCGRCGCGRGRRCPGQASQGGSQPGAQGAFFRFHHPVGCAGNVVMSESFLSQEEVDALLEGVTGESQKTVQEVHEEGEVRRYDISSQERIVRGRMPTMEIVNER